MIHVCDHEDGCFLMAKNMQKQKDDLFINVQQGGQLSLMDIDPTVSSSVENELISAGEIQLKLKQHLASFRSDIRLTKFLATFVNDYGLLCDFNMIHNMLDDMKRTGLIEIIRDPAFAQNGKSRTFWEEKKGQTITIRRLGS